MVRDNNIRIRIFKNRLLYVLVCVLSGLTAIPLLAILGEVLIKGWKQLMVIHYRGNSQCI